MLAPKCPICGEHLQYDLSTDGNYDDDKYTVYWVGFCDHCDIDYEWTEVFTITEIIGPKKLSSF